MSQPVDLSRIQETSDGDREFEQELFELFIHDCTERFLRLETAMAEQDAETVHREAHSLKGAGANIGTTVFQDWALKLEKTDLGADPVQARDLFSGLKTEYGRVKVFIEEHLAS